MSNYSDDWDKSVNAQDYVAVIYSYISLIVMVIIVTCFTMALCKRKSSTDRSGDTESDNEQETPEKTEQRQDIKAITRASVVAIVLYLLASILYPPILTKWIVIEKEHGNEDNNRLIALPLVPYMINTVIILFFILLRRLKTSFIGNTAETKHIRRRIHHLSWILPAMFLIVVIVITVITVIAPMSTSGANAVIIIFGGIPIVGYFIISAVYLRQISKIMAQKLIRNVPRMEMDRANIAQGLAMSTEALQNDANDEFDVIVDLQTVNDTIRCALLIVLCTLSNCLLPLGTALSAPQTRHESHRDTLRHFGPMTDIVCNTLCICLLFKFSEIWYFRLCGPCHQCALTCCVNKVGKEFVTKNPNHSRQDYVELILK